MERKVYKFLIESPKYIEIVKKKMLERADTEERKYYFNILRTLETSTQIDTYWYFAPNKSFIFYITDSRKYNFVH